MVRNSSRNNWWGKFLLPALLPLLLLAVWGGASAGGWTNTFLLPSPWEVLEAAKDLGSKGALQEHLAVSFGRVLAGFSISASCALLLAACHHSMPPLEQFMSVPLEAIRVIPPLATVPVLILWLGIGEASKLAIIVLASFFPVYLSTRTALSLCDPKLMQMAHTLRLTKLERLRLITVPQILPGAMTGLRLGFGYAWRALVGAEMIAAAAGLGYLIIDSEELARTDRVFVGIATIAITGLLLDAIFRRLLPQDKRQGALKGVF